MLSIGGAIFTASPAGWTQNAEVAMVFTGPISVPKDSVLALIIGQWDGNPNAGITSCTTRIRRGSTTGGTLIVGKAMPVITPSAQQGDVIMGIDTLLIQGTVQYALTVQGAGMSGTGSMTDASIAVIFLQ